MTAIARATHTPGPWTVRATTRVYAPDGGEVAVATKADPQHRHAAEANARVMAASPDLLGHLYAIVDGVTPDGGHIDFGESLVAARRWLSAWDGKAR